MDAAYRCQHGRAPDFSSASYCLTALRRAACFVLLLLEGAFELGGWVLFTSAVSILLYGGGAFLGFFASGGFWLVQEAGNLLASLWPSASSAASAVGLTQSGVLVPTGLLVVMWCSRLNVVSNTIAYWYALCLAEELKPTKSHDFDFERRHYAHEQSLIVKEVPTNGMVFESTDSKQLPGAVSLLYKRPNGDFIELGNATMFNTKHSKAMNCVFLALTKHQLDEVPIEVQGINPLSTLYLGSASSKLVFRLTDSVVLNVTGDPFDLVFMAIPIHAPSLLAVSPAATRRCLGERTTTMMSFYKDGKWYKSHGHAEKRVGSSILRHDCYTPSEGGASGAGLYTRFHGKYYFFAVHTGGIPNAGLDSPNLATYISGIVNVPHLNFRDNVGNPNQVVSQETPWTRADAIEQEFFDKMRKLNYSFGEVLAIWEQSVDFWGEYPDADDYDLESEDYDSGYGPDEGDWYRSKKEVQSVTIGSDNVQNNSPADEASTSSDEEDAAVDFVKIEVPDAEPEIAKEEQPETHTPVMEEIKTEKPVEDSQLVAENAQLTKEVQRLQDLLKIKENPSIEEPPFRLAPSQEGVTLGMVGSQKQPQGSSQGSKPASALRKDKAASDVAEKSNTSKTSQAARPSQNPKAPSSKKPAQSQKAKAKKKKTGAKKRPTQSGKSRKQSATTQTRQKVREPNCGA